MTENRSDARFSGIDLRLADGVDVTGEVEHLVGEAPLIRDRSALPLGITATFAKTCLPRKTGKQGIF